MTQNSISSGSRQASQLIYSDDNVNGINNLEYRASECIKLYLGSTVRLGGDFMANIDDCDNWIGSGGTNCYGPSIITRAFCNSIYDPVCGYNLTLTHKWFRWCIKFLSLSNTIIFDQSEPLSTMGSG